MKRGSWLLIIALALLLIGAAAFFIGSATTAQRRFAARTRLDLNVHAAREAAGKHNQSIAEQQPEAAAPPLAQDSLLSLLDAVEAVKKHDPEWRDLARSMEEAGDVWPVELTARLQTWMDANADLIAQIRALAASGAKLPEPILDPMEFDLEHVDTLRDANRLLLVYARLRMAQHDIAEAMGAVDDAMRLADFTSLQPYIMSQLARTSQYADALDVVNSAMAGHELSKEQLFFLEHRLQSAHGREQTAAAIAVEVQHNVEFFNNFRDGAVWRVLTPVVNLNEAAFTESIGELPALAAQPYYQVAQQLTTTAQHAAALPFTHVIASSLLEDMQPALINTIASQARHESQIDLARIAIALEQHYLQAGSYPESLDAIAPAFGGTLPLDPFSGNPFIFRPDSSAFILYSVGNNLRDDGGTINGREGDILWGQH